ncbi:MAG: phage tail tube protein [Candidatus Cohnella colombiensis]|uniref:Phage tail tube protein n=1 Tax=Candidatus Cohnella colombiensis TaxID=3121368 RepID=A0AA95F179_9BACL|nr:MAG: phage tail tube protein [Cohnella sp.]
MDLQTFAATRAVGTKIMIAAKAIASLKSIGGLDLSADTADVTTLDSDGGYREFIGTFKDGGEVPISGNFEPGNPGQSDVYDAFESGDTLPFSIIFPAKLGASWIFKGVVTKFTTGAELDGVVTFEATIKVSGKPSLGKTPSAGLSALALTGTGGTLSPVYNTNNSSYSFGGVTAASVTVTATGAGQTIKLFIDGAFSQDLTSGSASAAIPLTLNIGKKLTIMANEDGKTQKVYEVVVIKTA